METYEQISRLKYDLESKTLKDWALKYGIVDLARRIGSFKEIYLGSVLIRRSDLPTNDKDVIKRVRLWLYGNS